VADVVSVLVATRSSPSTFSTSRSHKQGCQFAIKAQGHSPASGFANTGNGVTIDLTSLHDVKISNDHNTASVGAGASWVQVYAALDPIGKSVAGGRNGNVGVGGLTLGGGISYFSPQVGFTCDTVVNFEIVLPSGKLVNANETSNVDLFRALKGGGNNFGVVTRFDFRTVDIGLIAAGSIVHPSDAAARGAVFAAFSDIASAPNYDVHTSLVTGLLFVAAAKKWTLSSTPIYTLPELHPPVYDELFKAPNVTSKMLLTELHVLANESATPPLNWLFRTGTYRVSAKLMEDIFQICNDTFYDVSLPELNAGEVTLLWDLAFEPLPTVFVSHGAGSNALGTAPNNGNEMVLLISAGWSATSTTESSNIQATADEALRKIDAAATAAGLSRDFVYANYAGPKQQPYRSYGRDNLAFLRRTATKYDPKGVFQQDVGGFKLQ
jgi:FAD/FMN-containing dehydrogenase